MAVNHSLIKLLLKMLMSLNIYRQKFECHFLASSVSTFKTEGLEACEYENRVQLDVLNRFVYSNVKKKK